MTARLMIGDVHDKLAELPDNSVDLVVTSPPFLALRSYLPVDHPDKHKEIGSETTPAAFIDTLLALTAEWRRILAPHGSICVELGDSFSGSGGAGGDYNDGGWRAGQTRFGGSASRGRESQWSEADALWLAGVIDTEGAIMIHRQDRPGAPSYRSDISIAMMEPQVCRRAAEITGVGNVNRDGRDVYCWHVSAQQARYVLLNIWPHLLIKQRQAKAAIELQRHIEEIKGRGSYSSLDQETIAYRENIREYVSGLNGRGDDRGKYVPTWEPPTPPLMQHSKSRSIGWPLAKSLTGIPTLYPWSLAYGRNLLTGEPSPAGRWRIRNVIVWARPNPPVGALGDKFRPATSYITVACTGPKRWFDLDAVRTEHVNDRPQETNGAKNAGKTEGQGHGFDHRTVNPAGAPPLDWHSDMPDEDGDWLWKLATQPYSGTTSTVRRVPCGPDDGGERTTSPDCPRHADLPGQLSKALRDERATANRSPSRRTQRSDDRHEPELLPDCESTDPHLEQVTPAQSLFPADTPAASPHSTPSRRTDRAPATTLPDTPSVQTDGHTGHTSTSPASSAPGASSDESNTTSDGSPASPGSRTSDGTGDIATSSELPCTCSFHKLTHESTSHYATFPLALPSRLIQAMCPQRVCTVCGKPSERIVESHPEFVQTGERSPGGGRGRIAGLGATGHQHTTRRVVTRETWSECGHDSYRPGLVLDPFSGSGTTLAAAIGCGRDAIGIDLDDRNAALTRERCGLFVETETGAP